MGIWFKAVTLEDFNKRGSKTCFEWLGMTVTELGDDFVKATMPVDHRTKQPMGIVNGGANVALAESVCSAAANMCVDQEKYRCVGLEVNANHMRPVFEGSVVTAICRPLHMGKKTHVWEARLESEGKLSCICRMTLAVVESSEITRKR